jgi:predicted nucleic acid-binding protein
MVINQTTLLFFDSSCLIAAAGSPTGGSSLLLAICARGFLKGAVSHTVLAEAEGNILTNLKPPALTRYRQEILSIPLLIGPVPSTTERETVAPITGQKDAHVAASALSIGAHFLITLDKRLAHRINESELSIHALSPGEIILTLTFTKQALRTGTMQDCGYDFRGMRVVSGR